MTDRDYRDREEGTPSPPEAEGVRWNTEAMATNFANIVNIQSTREQVDLFFGMDRATVVSSGPATIDLHSRVVLTPFAAKRLLLALTGVMNEYQSRYGDLPVER